MGWSRATCFLRVLCWTPTARWCTKWRLWMTVSYTGVHTAASRRSSLMRRSNNLGRWAVSWSTESRLVSPTSRTSSRGCNTTSSKSRWMWNVNYVTPWWRWSRGNTSQPQCWSMIWGTSVMNSSWSKPSPRRSCTKITARTYTSMTSRSTTSNPSIRWVQSAVYSSTPKHHCGIYIYTYIKQKHWYRNGDRGATLRWNAHQVEVEKTSLQREHWFVDLHTQEFGIEIINTCSNYNSRFRIRYEPTNLQGRSACSASNSPSRSSRTKLFRSGW